MSELALLGGVPVRTRPFDADNHIGAEEKAAVMAVLDSGVLSRYVGSSGAGFRGGSVVQAFEREWAETFGVKHALAVNSATSGLQAAVGAAGVGPGDEVIVSPFTMCASATCALFYGAVPVFADIDPATFNLTAETIQPKITPRTKAIIVVDIHGQPADMDPIMALAREHGIIVIEDSAQAPFALYKGRKAGTLADIGVFSLNYHKHIHTGEGGVVVSNNDDLALRIACIRNHAEASAPGAGVPDLVNMVGFNFRMTEIEAAIGRCQIKKGAELIARRQENVRYLEERIRDLPGLTMPKVIDGATSAYYVHGLLYDEAKTGVSRERYVEALAAELPLVGLREDEGKLVEAGYVSPIYLMPLFQRQIAIGRNGFPFRAPQYNGVPDYSPGLCPNAERVHATIVIHEYMKPTQSRADMGDVIAAFTKVHANLHELRHKADRAR
jgi:perosamine synthetase